MAISFRWTQATASWLIILLILTVSVAADDDLLLPQPAPPNCCPPLCPPECRQCGNAPQASLAIPPECWPPQCNRCVECDPLQSSCPDREDYFLLPPRPNWYVYADGAAFQRVPTHGVNFASLGLPPPGATGPTNVVLSTSDFNYDFRAAGRIVLGHTFNECLQLEGEYLGVSESQNVATVRNSTLNGQGGNGNLFSPFGGFGLSPIGNLDYNNFAQIRYSSSLQGVELNIRRKYPLPPEKLTMSLLFGVRYFGMPEDFYYFTQSDTVFNPPSPPASGTVFNTIRVTTDNQMIGPQIGGLFSFYVDNRWWMNFEIKAAVLNNRASQSTFYQSDVNGTVNVYSTNVKEDHTSFAGQLNLTFVYRWSPHFSTRFGYQALWLTNLAMAPDNLNTDIDFIKQGPAQLNHSGSVVYHGPMAGIEWGW